MSSVLKEDRLIPPVETESVKESSRQKTDSVIHAGWRPTIALATSVGLALRGQQLVTQRNYPLDGPLFFAVAIGLFLWGLNHVSGVGRVRQLPLPGLRDRSSPQNWVANREYRLWLSVIAAMSAILAYQGFAGNHFSTIGVLSWLGALACFLLAVAERPEGTWWVRLTGRQRPESWTVRITGIHIALIGITLLAIFFRVHRLADVPAEMTSDHAEKLLDVNDVLHGLRPIFFRRNTGREALQFYLTAVLIRATPLTIGHLALKVGTALFGIIAIPLTYLLVRELYGQGVALLASTLLAMSHWHVAITRVGLRFPFTAAFAVPTLYFTFRAFKYNRRNDWLAAGLVLGAGLHTYMAMRVVPLLLIVLVGIKFIWDLAERLRNDYRRTASSSMDAYAESSSLQLSFWENAIFGGLAAVLTFLPLLRYMIDEPEMFWYRGLTRMSSLEREVSGDPWHIFWGNVKNAFLMFNYRGDVVWVNTVPNSPVLGWVTGSLFVLGVAYLLWRLGTHHDRRPLYVLVSLFMLLLPSIMSLAFPNENPSVVRAGGAVPIATLIAALPLYTVYEGVRRSNTRAGAWLAGILIVGLLSLAVRDNYNWYFVTYDQQYRRSSWNSTEMGKVVRGFADSVGDLNHAYHVSYPHWVDTRNIGINAGDVTWENAIMDRRMLQEHVKDPAAKLYLVYEHDEESLSLLQSLFPKGQLRRYKSKTPEKDFYVFFVPAQGLQ